MLDQCDTVDSGSVNMLFLDSYLDPCAGGGADSSDLVSKHERPPSHLHPRLHVVPPVGVALTLTNYFIMFLFILFSSTCSHLVLAPHLHVPGDPVGAVHEGVLHKVEVVAAGRGWVGAHIVNLGTHGNGNGKLDIRDT